MLFLSVKGSLQLSYGSSGSIYGSVYLYGKVCLILGRQVVGVIEDGVYVPFYEAIS
jgi:hypothetical protein